MSKSSSVEVVTGPSGPNIRFNGRLLYSSRSTSEKRVESLPRVSNALYFVVSPLLFHGMEQLEKYIPSDSVLAAVEHDPELYKISINYFKRHKFSFSYRLLSSSEDPYIFEIVKRYRCRKIIPVKLNLGYMLYRKFYDQVINIAESSMKNFWNNRMTTIHMGRLWCRNIILNMPYFSEARPFSSIKTNKPVICLGAGESLEYSLDFIKKNRKLFFLSAADTAVTTLLLSGIKPDLVIALESQHANLYDFYENDALKLPVAADLTSSPELLRKLKGPVYFYISQFEHSAVFDRLSQLDLFPPMIPPLGSVGITAVFLSLMLTSNYVFFTGLDFSFIPDKYHASGSPSHIISQIHENRVTRAGFYDSAFRKGRIKEIDKSDRTVFTDPIMKLYSDTLCSLSAQHNRIFDISVTGLETGAKHLTEKEVLQVLTKNVADNKNQPDAAGPGASADNSVLKENTVIFLKSELSLIEQAVIEVVKFQNERNDSDTLPDTISDLLNKLDYTWLFFPDKTPIPSSNSSFLKRFLFSASWFKTQILHAIALS